MGTLVTFNKLAEVSTVRDVGLVAPTAAGHGDAVVGVEGQFEVHLAVGLTTARHHACRVPQLTTNNPCDKLQPVSYYVSLCILLNSCARSLGIVI